MKTDLQIQTDVQEELKWEPFLKASEIGVSVKKGIVTLSGTVDSYSKKLRAEETAKRVSGVTVVVQKIEVALPSVGKRTDIDIAEAALNALKWNNIIPGEKLKVKVEEGWITLEGEVEWEYQRASARNSIENLVGVTGVSNKIKVTPQITPTAIKQKIRSAFQRNANIDSESIHVEIKGDKVILSGKVRSWAEKKEAETAAWLAPGITTVDNNIEIDSEIYTLG